MVPNPRAPNRLGRVDLSPDKVDCIVFWTKNPAPMLDKLDRIEAMGHKFYFQFTLTAYGKTIERNVPPETELTSVFAELAHRLGPERIVWRYDPVLLDSAHSIHWHYEHFYGLCEKLHPFTHRCIVSFIHPYRHIANRFQKVLPEDRIAVASELPKIAGKYGLSLFACAEETDLMEYGVGRSSCIDLELIEQLVGYGIRARKDTGQRPACTCIESVDIGIYDTCTNECAYCYATTNPNTALRRSLNHDPDAPMLTGYPAGDEIIRDRTTKSQKTHQLRIF